MADEDGGTTATEETTTTTGGDDTAAATDAGVDAGAEGEEKGKTALETGGEDTAAVASPATWPETWRQDMAKHIAGTDSGEVFDKELKRLERMSTPADAYKSFRELERRMASGEIRAKSEFPADGSDEDKAKWRQDNGIPESPDAYLEKMEGIVIGDDDKPMVESYLASAHEANLPPEAVKTGLDWYYRTQEKVAEEQAGRDASFHDEAVEKLRADMGADYKRNMNDLNGWLASGPEGLADNLFGARLADGTLLGDNPETLSWLVSQMREINPLSTITPSGGTSDIQSVEEEIADIQRLIATDPQKYWGDKEKQDRFQKLVAARDGHKKKAS